LSGGKTRRDRQDWAWSPCLDKDEGEVAEFGYPQADPKVFRRYVVKRIPKGHGEQLDLESGAYNDWVLVTNDHAADAAAWSPSIATRPWWSRDPWVAEGPPGFWFADALNGWGVHGDCNDPIGAATDACAFQAVKTSDGGKSWAPVGSQQAFAYKTVGSDDGAQMGFVAAEAQTGWLLGSNPMVTHDGGHSLPTTLPRSSERQGRRGATPWATYQWRGTSRTCLPSPTGRCTSPETSSAWWPGPSTSALNSASRVARRSRLRPLERSGHPKPRGMHPVARQVGKLRNSSTRVGRNV
jgi:hypothetical protein